jgi:hypothetical protein
MEVGCDDFLRRQNALSVATARAVASRPPEAFAGFELFLISNAADEVNDAWLRLSGSKGQETLVFLELVAIRVRRWFRKPVFRVALTAHLPPGSLDDVVNLLENGAGLAQWDKERGGRWAMQIFAAEVGQPVMSHAPGSRLVVR